MKKLFLLLILPLLWGFQAQAQDRKVLETIDGIEVSYEIQLLRSIDRKNEDKSRDEYQIVGYVTNNSGKDLYTDQVTPFRVEVSNATSLNKAAKPTPQRSNYETLDPSLSTTQTLYLLKAGVTIQDVGKVRVPKGLDPIINYEKQGFLKPLSEWALKANAAIINGTWNFQHNNTAVTMEYNATDNTIVQRSQGSTILWYWSNNNTYERYFEGLSLSTDAQVRDATASYKVTLTLTQDGRLMYRNSEGITVYLKKQ